MTHEQYAYWLAGIMDGEGWVAYSPDKPWRAVGICNTDATLIERIEEALDVLGITYHKRDVPPQQPHHKPQWRIEITGKDNLIKFYNWVPFQSPKKVRRLYGAITSYKNRVPNETSGLVPFAPPSSGGELLDSR